MEEERILEIRLTLRDPRSIEGLEIDHECMPMRRRDGVFEMDAIAKESTVAKLRSMETQGVQVEVVSRAAAVTSVEELVSPINRYADGSLPRGAGKRRG